MTAVSLMRVPRILQVVMENKDKEEIIAHYLQYSKRKRRGGSVVKVTCCSR